MLYIFVNFCQNILNCFQLTELTRVHGRKCHFQYLLCSKGSNSKSGLTRARVLVFCTLYYGTLHLSEISRKYLKLFSAYSGHKYMVEMTKFNVLRKISPNLGKSELWFISSARRITKLLISVKCHQNISNGFQLTERTLVHGRNGYF